MKLGEAHAPLTLLIARTIRERILNGTLAPGERLVETRLSEELGVSRVPVREALRSLAADGVVTIEPRRGASVTAYSPELIRELVEVRATLEALNAKLAARRHNPDLIARLQQIVSQGAEIAKGADPKQLHDDNSDFHEALAGIAANSVLRDMVRSLRERTAPIFAPHSRKRARENWEEHAAIVRAVVAGDAELAGLLAARHVYSAAEVVPQAMVDERHTEPAAANDASSPHLKAEHRLTPAEPGTAAARPSQAVGAPRKHSRRR